MRGGKINSIECKEQSGIKHYFIINNLKKLKSLMEKEVLAEEIFDKMVIEIFKAADIKFDDFIKNNKIVGTGFFQEEKSKYYFIFTSINLYKDYQNYLHYLNEIVELIIHADVQIIANRNGSTSIDLQDLFWKGIHHLDNIDFRLEEKNLIKFIFRTINLSDPKQFINESLNNLQSFINTYSYISKLGLKLIRYGLSKKPRKNIYTSFGATVQMYHGVRWNDFKNLIEKSHSVEFLLDNYNKSICEINPKSKLLILWGIIEDVFFEGDFISNNEFTKSQCLLDDEEKSKFQKLLNDSNLSCNKQKIIYDRICELKECNRNSIIAKNISHFLNIDCSLVDKKIKKISKIRGIQAHTTKKYSVDLIKSNEYLLDILERTIDKIFIKPV